MKDHPAAITEINLAHEAEMPPLPMSIGTTLVNKTGTWRYFRPFYEDKTPPCNNACPAGEDIVGYLALLKEGRYEEAWRLLTQENPFPGVCGRVCPHPCESECNRIELGGAVAIHTLERFLADEAAARKLSFVAAQRIDEEPVVVIGAGPAGLACAYHLALWGHPVTVYEAAAKPGGMMRLIPPYRLPAHVLDREIANIEALGVRILTGQRLGGNLSWGALQHYQAVFLAVGQSRSRKLGIAGEKAEGVLSGIDFLARIERGEAVRLGRRVAIIGGGNTAMDAARTARRSGAEVTILYRRSRKEMPAAEAEITEAEEEGIAIHYLTAPVKIWTENSRVKELECIKMALGEPDASGRPRPVPLPGSEHRIPVDTILPALGQEADLSFLDETIQIAQGQIATDSATVTSRQGVFAGGDVATGYGTVAHAIGSGKRAALAIHHYLRGESLESFPPLSQAVHRAQKSLSPTVVRLENLNQDRLTFSARPSQRRLDAQTRQQSFDEVNLPLDEFTVRFEAERCFSCGICNACDTCLIHCPDVAIKRDGLGRYRIDYDYCKGCNICAVECPRDAMSTEEESKWKE